MLVISMRSSDPKSLDFEETRYWDPRRSTVFGTVNSSLDAGVPTKPLLFQLKEGQRTSSRFANTSVFEHKTDCRPLSDRWLLSLFTCTHAHTHLYKYTCIHLCVMSSRPDVLGP